MELKPDIKEAKERLDAWWDHEILDRPIISYYIPKKGRIAAGYNDARCQDWTLALNYDTIEEALNGFEKRANRTVFGGEAIPTYHPNYGAGIMAAIFGIEPKFQSDTVWFNCPTNVKDIISLLENVKLNRNNVWYSRLITITEYAAKRANGNYHVAMVDLGGVLDILSSFLGPTNMILTMKRYPEIIDTCREIILEKLLLVYDKLQDIIEKHTDGCNAWLNIWCKKRWYPVQCDFIAMLNPKWFKRFALPDIITQIEHMDYAIYHMDGPYQIPYLDDFLNISNLTGIQWVPGSGNLLPGSDEWKPLYKKIQKAGKNIVIDTLPHLVPHIFRSLDKEGLYVRTYYISNRTANFYLPGFMGGQDAKLINNTVNWAKDNNRNNIKKEEFDEFLNNMSLILQDKVKKELLSEINTILKGDLALRFT
ncbi:MAG: hypothetical protein ACFE8L_01505 [Candidatus Hodarchaeota archaeon]